MSSWKVRHEIGKNEVRKSGLKLESKTEVGRRLMKLKSAVLTLEKSLAKVDGSRGLN